MKAEHEIWERGGGWLSEKETGVADREMWVKSPQANFVDTRGRRGRVSVLRAGAPAAPLASQGRREAVVMDSSVQAHPAWLDWPWSSFS